MVAEEIINNIELAREIINTTDSSIVIIKNGEIIKKQKGEEIQLFYSLINDLTNQVENSIVGVKNLGKAFALLCKYFGISGVYSKHATKTGIAILITSGIPSEIDEMIPGIMSQETDEICNIEEKIKDIESTSEAYDSVIEILSNKG